MVFGEESQDSRLRADWSSRFKSSSILGPTVSPPVSRGLHLLPAATRGPYTLGIVSRLTSSFVKRGGFPMSNPASLHETNPLRQALPRTQAPEPCTVVLFGATG